MQMRVRSSKIPVMIIDLKLSYGDKFERVGKLTKKKTKTQSTPGKHPLSRVVLLACKPKTQKIRKKKSEFQASFGCRTRPSLEK